MRFPVVLHTDDGVRFGVTVPDLPGCFSAGDDFDDALSGALEAIELHPFRLRSRQAFYICDCR